MISNAVKAASKAPGQASYAGYTSHVFEQGKIEFDGLQLDKSAKVSINNRGCGAALFDRFKRMSP